MKKFPKYEFHPIANVFPLMTDEEIDELAKDIKVNGLTCPIILYHGKILDGRNRYLACLKAGVTPKFIEYTDEAPIKFSLSLNLHRRHLTISQRAAIAADVANLEQGQRADFADTPNGGSVTQLEAADLLHVSLRTVQRAVAVRSANPVLHAEVLSGETTLGEATSEIINGTNVESNGAHAAEIETEEVESKEQAAKTAKREAESLARKKCLEQFKAFVRDMSQQLRTPQREIKGFIRVFLMY